MSQYFQSLAFLFAGWVPRQPPAEQRSLQWLAFAKQCLGSSNTCITWDLSAFATIADAIASHPPYRAPLANFRVVFHHAKLATSLVPQALNGAVVAFTAPATDAAADGEADIQAADTAPSVCLAMGIVRSVDPAKGLLYILAPVSLDVLQQATTIEVSAHPVWVSVQVAKQLQACTGKLHACNAYYKGCVVPMLYPAGMYSSARASVLSRHCFMWMANTASDEICIRINVENTRHVWAASCRYLFQLQLAGQFLND